MRSLEPVAHPVDINCGNLRSRRRSCEDNPLRAASCSRRLADNGGCLPIRRGVTVKQSTGGPANVQQLTPDQLSKIQKLANIQRIFVKAMNSPGVTLSSKEIDRTRAADHTLINYVFYTTGLPKNSLYDLFEVRMDGSIVKDLEGVSLDAEGKAICEGRAGTCKGNGPGDIVGLSFSVSKSEPKRIALVSQDGQFKAAVSLIPFPKRRHGQRLPAGIGPWSSQRSAGICSGHRIPAE